MCETAVITTPMYVPWVAEAHHPNTSERLSTFHRDILEGARLRSKGFRSVPSNLDEEEAARILAPFEETIQSRFGLDRVSAGYVLCVKAIESGRPITAMARALAQKLEAP